MRLVRIGLAKGGAMDGTLVFVHGTGVRQAGYTATLTAVKKGIGARLPDVRVVGVDWGDKYGVSLQDVDDTLPPQILTRDASGALPLTDADLEAARWALLIDDPLFELRLAGQQSPAPSGLSFGALPEQAVLQRLDQVRQAPPDVADSGISTAELVTAIGWVHDAPELVAGARGTTGPDDPELAEAIASAVVARLLADHRHDEPGTAPTIAMEGSVRDALVNRLENTIAPEETRGFATKWLKGKVVEFVERLATPFVADRRGGLTAWSTPMIGDILLYQRRGEEMRQLVADTLGRAVPPVVAVGHSLGGIILVDLLSGPQAPAVRQLVTAGSQSSLFYVIDALVYLRRGAAQPVPFTPWLNIYNHHDFLSFCAARVFASVQGISDKSVDPRVPFPPSHSAYWHHGPVYDLIAAAWPRP
jgi:hypothetical protein